MENVYDNHDNLTFFDTIKKGGNIEFFCKNLNDLIFRQDKIDKNLKSDFLKNYIAIVLDELDIDEVNVYFDKTARSENSNKIAFTDKDNNIFLPCDILSSFKHNVFFDFMAIAHELKHVQINLKNQKIVRTLNNNSDETIFPTYENLLQELGYSDNDIHIFYLFNKHEILANDFAYNYVLNLIDKLNNNFKNNEILDNKLLKVYKLNLCYLFKCYYEELEKNKDYYENILVPSIFSKQSELFVNMKELFVLREKELKKNESYDPTDLHQTVINLFNSFRIAFNQNIANKIRAYTKKTFIKIPLVLILSTMLISFENYVVSKEDLYNHFEYFNYLDGDVDFKELNMDRKTLIECYLDYKLGLENNKTLRDFIIQSIEIDNIETSKDLLKTLTTKIKNFNNKEK